MTRRTVLTLLVALSLLLAGCAGTGGPPATERPTTDDTMTDRTSPPTTDGYYRAYEFSATEVSEADVARDVTLSQSDLEGRLTWGADSFAATLFADGAAEQVDIDERDATSVGILDESAVLRANGTYYAVEKSVVSRHEGPAYSMELEGPLRPDFHDDYERAEREAVDFSDLSAADRDVFEYAVPPAEEHETTVSTSGYDYVFASSVDESDATLVDGEVHYVRYEGDLFRIVSDGRKGTKVRYRVRYELERIADSPEAFIEDRLPSLVTPLNESNATERTRGVLVDAIEGGAVEWEGRSEAPARIRDADSWVQEHPPEGSDAYVRYGGTLYRIEVTKIVE